MNESSPPQLRGGEERLECNTSGDLRRLIMIIIREGVAKLFDS